MSDSVDGVEGWGEYRKLVLAELERMNRCNLTLTEGLADAASKTAINSAALERLSSNLSRLTWLVIGAVVSGLAGMIFKWVGH